VAGYSAVIDLRVNGLEGLRVVTERVESINRLIKSVKPVPTLFSGTAATEVKTVTKELSELVKKYADGDTRAVKFSTSLAGLNNQLNAFKTVAANAKVGSTEFTNSLKAAERASNNLVAAELERLRVLETIYTREAAESAKGPSGMTKNVLELGKQLPTSIAGLKAYATELDRVFNLVEAGSLDYRTLQQEITRVNKALDVASGQGAMQGPALPPQPGRPAPGTLRFRQGMSINELEDLKRNWTEYLNTLPFQGKQFTVVDRQIGKIEQILGQGGKYGPALPPGFSERGITPAAAKEKAQAVSDAGAGRQGPLLPLSVGGGFDLPPFLDRLAPRPLQGMQMALSKPGRADAIIGGAFPALFGGGPGSILGGAIGGLAGGIMGGPLGMALSVGISAIGQKIDEAVQKVKELGDALSTLNVDRLRETFIIVNAELETTVRRSLELGNGEAARAELAREIAYQTGAVGHAIEDSTSLTNLLGDAWGELTGSASALLSMIAMPFTAALAGIVKILALAVKGVNFIFSVIGAGLRTLLPDVLKNVKATNEEEEKLKAALVESTDAAHRRLLIAVEQEKIDVRRTHAVTTLGKLINLQADTEIKQLKLREATEDKIRDLKVKYSKLTDETSKRELNLAIAQEQAQFNIAKREIDRAANRERLKILNDQIIAQDKLQQQIISNTLQIETARSSARQQILAAQTQELEQRKQFATSLNQESAINNQIATNKITAAKETFKQLEKEQATRAKLAAAELASVEAAYKRGFATETQLRTAQENLNTVSKTVDATLEGARATEQQALKTADLERRQANVADYAERAAYQTELFNRATEKSLNTLNSNLSVMEAYNQTQLTINNLEIQRLETQMSLNKEGRVQYDTIYKIAELEKANALATLHLTRAQIQAEVERQRIAVLNAEVKYQELVAVAEIARAEGVITDAHTRAIQAQASAVDLAYQNLDTSVKIANEQMRAADAVYNAAIEAADLKVSTTIAAQKAASFASSMQSAAGSAQAAADAVSSTNQEGVVATGTTVTQIIASPVLTRLTKFNFGATKPKLLEAAKERFGKQVEELQRHLEELDAAREQRLASIRENVRVFTEERKQEMAAFMQSQATSAYSPGADTPSTINVQTGPVIQQDNQMYVTMSDMENAMQTVATTILGNNRSAGGRRFAGIS